MPNKDSVRTPLPTIEIGPWRFEMDYDMANPATTHVVIYVGSDKKADFECDTKMAGFFWGYLSQHEWEVRELPNDG